MDLSPIDTPAWWITVDDIAAKVLARLTAQAELPDVVNIELLSNGELAMVLADIETAK